MTPDVTVCVATIPPRADKLSRCLRSIAAQTYQPAQIIVEYDHGKTGAAATKNRALAAVRTPWVAFCDDDDELLRDYLYHLRQAAEDTGADVVYPDAFVPQIVGNRDPQMLAGPFNADVLRQRSYIYSTCLFKTDLAREVGGYQHGPNGIYDDHGLWLAMLDAGATFHHLEEQLFIWNHDGGNTSGQPHRW